LSHNALRIPHATTRILLQPAINGRHDALLGVAVFSADESETLTGHEPYAHSSAIDLGLIIKTPGFNSVAGFLCEFGRPPRGGGNYQRVALDRVQLVRAVQIHAQWLGVEHSQVFSGLRRGRGRLPPLDKQGRGSIPDGLAWRHKNTGRGTPFLSA